MLMVEHLSDDPDLNQAAALCFVEHEKLESIPKSVLDAFMGWGGGQLWRPCASLAPRGREGGLAPLSPRGVVMLPTFLSGTAGLTLARGNTK